MVIYTPKGTNNRIDLLFGSSLYDLRQHAMPAEADLTSRDGLRMFRLESAIVRVPAIFFNRYPTEAQVALAGIHDATEILIRLLDQGRSVIAGRLAGAFRRAGREEIADEIKTVMAQAGYDVRETDPFSREHALAQIKQADAPIVGRLRSLWQSTREQVIAVFPKPPGLPKDIDTYLASIDEAYRVDAYHSLSIEGYRVTAELIDRVRSGDWNPDGQAGDKADRNALAARGYWQAFMRVRSVVRDIVKGEAPGPLVAEHHRDWYRALFQPSVAAGLIEPPALAGYRIEAIYLRGSRHVPPRPEVLPDAMSAFFELLHNENEACVRAVLGHWLFGYIHPYPDGNGRIARFVMNALLASGGYPWTTIPVHERSAYLASLESASLEHDIVPFTEFVARHMRHAPQSIF